MAVGQDENMEVKKNLSMVRKTVHRTENNNVICGPQCSKRGYKHRMMERKMELPYTGDAEIALVAGKQGILAFSQAARLMGVSRHHLQTGKEETRASRLSAERCRWYGKPTSNSCSKANLYETDWYVKTDFRDITEYYTAEEIALKYKGQCQMGDDLIPTTLVPKVRIRCFNCLSMLPFAQIWGGLDDWMVLEYSQEKWRHDTCRHPVRMSTRNNIHPKKTCGQMFYRGYDLSKNSRRQRSNTTPSKEAWKNSESALDSNANILQFHQINREEPYRFLKWTLTGDGWYHRYWLWATVNCSN